MRPDHPYVDRSLPYLEVADVVIHTKSRNDRFRSKIPVFLYFEHWLIYTQKVWATAQPVICFAGQVIKVAARATDYIAGRVFD